MIRANKGRKLHLVHAAIDKGYQDAAQHHAPPLALVCLKTAVQRATDDVDVTILDGTQLDEDQIIARVRAEAPDTVGLSVQQLSYDSGLQVARAAKEVGATVICGGQHATQIAKEIILNRHGQIDAVVSNDGEIPLAAICQGLPFETIPNLTWWDGSVRQNPAAHPRQDVYPAPDYSDLDLSPYVNVFTRRLGFPSPRLFLRTYSHRGCGNRAGSQACYFCGRADKGVRFKSPKKHLADLVALRGLWGADEVFDVGDDIAFDKAWLRTMAEMIEAEGLDLPMGCFGRAARLRDPEVALLLHRMGVTSVIIGFESGDSDLLAHCGKGSITPEDNLAAARNLFDNGIDTCASYVIGLPGESETSAQHTFENAERLVDLAERHLGRKPYELVCNLFEPNPGSPAFRRVKEFFPARYEGQDRLDLATVQNDYFGTHWRLTTEEEVRDFRGMLVKWARRINSLTTEADCQGFRADEIKTREFAPAEGTVNV